MSIVLTPPPPLSKRLRHKTLSAYYPHLQTLRDYLVSTLGCPLTQLLHPDDPERYTELLDTTISAVSSDDHARLWNDAGRWGDVEGTQQEAIDRIMREVARSATRNHRDVLLSGSRTYSEDLPINTNRPTIENRHVNSPSSVLRTLEWKILRSRLGDQGFRHLLVHTSLFLTVGNNCFIQLSGTPLYDMYDAKGPKGIRGMKRSSEVDQGVDKGTGDQRRRKRRRRNGGGGGGGGGDGSDGGALGDGEERMALHQMKRKVSASGKGKGRAVGPADEPVARQRMFYGHPAKRADGKLLPGVPPSHILNKLMPSRDYIIDNTACLRLVRAVFPALFGRARQSHHDGVATVDLERDLQRLSRSCSRRIPPLIGVMRELVVRHSSTDYRTLLWRCIERRGGTDGELQPVSHSQVSRFVTSVLKSLLSTSIIGSRKNLEAICRHARAFINAKQYESTTLHSLMQGLSVDDIQWLDISSDSNSRTASHDAVKRRRLVEDFVFWLFSDFLIPLIKNTFYITETASTRYETVYFLHDDWTVATGPHFKQLEVDLLEELDSNEGFFALQGRLGVSAVRLVPKPNGFRPIVNLGRRIKERGLDLPGIPVSGMAKSEAMSANQILRGVHQVLTLEKERKRDLLGSSLFGTNEIFTPLQSLKKDLMAKHGELPGLYFVKMDIKAAFDTIKQDKMLQDHDYCLMLYCLLLPPASKASQGSARRIFKTRALVNDEMWTGFGEHAKTIATPLRNAVIIDLVRRRPITREACMDLLRTHIKENVWQVGNRLFRQREGIPQGSKISSLLCSFFYSHLEREHLGWINQPGSRLLRYIDDFMLITDDYHHAKRFVATMSRGFPEYGAFVSSNKTLLSFEHATGSQVAPVCGVSDAGRPLFPYCGFFIDMSTLDISMDYPRAITTPMQQSFALRSSRRRGANFVGWLSRQLENRNHIAYLDTHHNDIDTVHLNIFLNFALTAMKVPHYFDRTRDRTEAECDVIFTSLGMAAEYTHVAGRARVKHASRADRSKEHYAVKRQDFIFLAKTAMLKVLAKKASRFKKVVHLLTEHLGGREYRGMLERHEKVVNLGWQAVCDARY